MNVSNPSTNLGVRDWWSALAVMNLLPLSMAALITTSKPELAAQYVGLLGLLIISLLIVGNVLWYLWRPRSTNDAAELSRWEARTRADLDNPFSPIYLITIFLFIPALLLVLLGPMFVLLLGT